MRVKAISDTGAGLPPGHLDAMPFIKRETAFNGFDAESSLVVDVEALMKLILVSLQFTFVGMIVFALTFLVTVVPDAEPTRDAVRIGSLISTIVLAAALILCRLHVVPSFTDRIPCVVRLSLHDQYECSKIVPARQSLVDV